MRFNFRRTSTWETKCILAVITLGLLLTSCSRDSNSRMAKSKSQLDPNNPVLASVGERQITLKEFQAEMQRRAHEDGVSYTTADARTKLLDQMVQFETVLAQARASGFDQKPEIRAQVNQLIVARFQEEQLARTKSPTSPDETETLAFYQQHPARYATPGAVHAAVIFLKCSAKATEEKRAEFKQEAEQLLAEVRSGDAEAFRQQAARRSDDQASRYSGGDTGWLLENSESQWNAAVVQAAFAISKPGGCAPLVETPDGFYIVRLLEKKSPGVRPFEEVKDAIAYQLTEEHRHRSQLDLLESMQNGLRIELHPELLKSIESPVQAVEAKPPSAPRS